MTEDQKNEQISRIVREYSDNEVNIGALTCRLRRLGELMRTRGPQLVENLDQVNPADFDDLAEVREAIEKLERAQDTRRTLAVSLRDLGLEGLVR